MPRPMQSLTIGATCAVVTIAAHALTATRLVAQRADSAGHRDAPQPALPRNSWYPVPVVTKTQVAGVKVQGIMALLHRFSLDSVTRPSLLFVTAIVTQNKQYGAAVGGDLWLPGNQYNINYIVQYEKSPAPFYGVGPNTTAATLERDDSRTWSGQVIAERALRPADYAQLGLTVASQHMTSRRGKGALASDTLTGRNGYTKTALLVGLSHDSRTSTYFPRGGSWVQAQAVVNLTPLGGSTAFSIATVDARGYFTATRGAILAIQGVVQGAGGNVPFELLPQLGGDALRAYEDGRWRDRALVRGQVEWRQQLFWRLRADLFVAAGAVSPTFGSLKDAPLRNCYGAGLRFLFTKKMEGYMRGDFARGDDGTTALTIGWAEAF